MGDASTRRYRAQGDRNAAVRLFGREREQSHVQELLSELLAGLGSLTLIGGEAGIGKTALVEELGRLALDANVRVVTGRSYDLSITPAFGPWLEILEAFSTTADSLPIQPDGSTPEVTSPDVFYRQILNFLRRQSEEQPLLIVLDDAHWADNASLELLRFLSRHLASMPTMIVVTFRTEAMASGNTLFSLVPLLVRESDASRVDLHPLDHDALRSWVHHNYELDQDAEIQLTKYLELRSEGIPLFARETMRTIEEEQALWRTGGRWQLGELQGSHLSLLVQQIAEARLNRVSMSARELLGIAAVIGEEIPLDLWGQIAEVSEDAILNATEEAVNAWLLVAEPYGARVRFQHGLYRQAIYEQILPPRRRRLHRQVAEALINLDSPEPERIAYHFQQIGDVRAVEWLQQVGTKAWRSWAWQEAAARFEAAIELLDDQTGRDRDRGWLLLQLAECLRYNSPADTFNCIHQAETIALAYGDQALAAMALWVRGRTNVSSDRHGLPDLEAAIEIMNELPVADRERILQRTGNLTEHAPAILSVWRAISGRYAGAIEAAGSYLALPDDQRTPLIDAEALLAQGIALGVLGHPEASREAFDATLGIYISQEDHVSIAHTSYLYLLEEILPYEADNLAKREQIAQCGNDSWRLATEQTITPARIISPPVLFLDGRWDEVRDITARTLGLTSYVRLWTLPFGMMVARYQCDPERVQALQQLGLPHDFSYREDQVWLSLILAQLQVVALLALDEGDLPAAREWINRHEHLLNATNRVTGKSDGLLLRARLLRLCGDVGGATSLARQALELASEPRQPLAQMVAYRILGELYLESGQLALAENQLQHAWKLALACNVQHEQILTSIGFANLAIANGELEQAAGRLEDARKKAQHLGARLIIDRIDGAKDKLEVAIADTDYPAGLTPREVDVLRHIVNGDTDIEIANALHISPRTVANHVASILRKTDAKSRAAAAAYAVRNGIA